MEEGYAGSVTPTQNKEEASGGFWWRRWRHRGFKNSKKPPAFLELGTVGFVLCPFSALFSRDQEPVLLTRPAEPSPRAPRELYYRRRLDAMISLLTRANFVGRVAVLTTAGLLSSVANTSSHPALCAEMANTGNVKSPDFAAWDSVVKAHVKPSEIRGIAVNAVDYAGVL